MGRIVFEFNPSAWLDSMEITLMKPEHEGAFIRLLCYMWKSGDCSLPDNDQILSTLSRLNEGWFKGGSRVVKPPFTPHPEKIGYLTYSNLYFEYKRQENWLNKSKEGGQKSALKRIKKPKINHPSNGGSTTLPTVVQPPFNHPSQMVQNFDEKNNSLIYSKENTLSKDKKEKKEREIFKEPSLEQVIAYFQIQPDTTKKQAENYYDSKMANGWMAGKSKLKNWKADANKWIRAGWGKNDTFSQTGQTQPTKRRFVN